MATRLKAFEGVEGFGSDTVGGRGGVVVKVTNLNDSGPGSLRHALESVHGPRTVVFDVSGSIVLKTQILVQDPNVTIAGQTAPGDGITIEGSRIRFKAGEAIVQGLKFRPGDGVVGQSPADRDGMFIGTTDHAVKNIVIDHNTFTWATDENFTINGNVHNVSITNNIFAEGLSQSINPKGEHSKGLMVSNWSSKQSDYNTNITIAKNLFAHNMDRNPEIRAGQNIEIINNYIYDPGRGDRVIAIGGGSSGTLDTTVNVVGNVIDAGLSTANVTKGPINLTKMGTASKVFLSDNTQFEKANVTVQMGLVTDTGGARSVSKTEAFQGSGVDLLPSSDVRSHVLENAGADPFARDVVDQRIIHSATDGTGKLIHTVTDVRVTVASAQPARDTDGDGMADWFETRFGLDSKVKDHNGDSDRDGYTNMEEYIQGLLRGYKLDGPRDEVTVAATAGSDTFVFGSDFTQVAPKITGFNAGSDKLDIGALLTNFDRTIHKFSDFVEVVEAGGSLMVSVDRDGAGEQSGLEFVAELQGMRDVDALLSSLLLTAPKSPSPPVIPPSPPVIPPSPPVIPPSPPVVLPVPVDPVARVLPPNAPGVISGTAGADRLTGSAAGSQIFGLDGNDRLIGRNGNDWLEGGDGNDWLEGGAGNDWMAGGSGNDTYLVDSALDVVTEATANGTDAGGIDLVRSSVSYKLGDYVENLLLSGMATDGTGNALNNVMTGNDADNVLRSEEGSDTLRGGRGNDSLFGGAGADRLEGGEGNDWLEGGLGADVLHGGAGADSFVFNTLPGIDNIDMIADFDVLLDEIVLDDAIFTALHRTADGNIAASDFVVGSRALTADHNLIYNASNGNLLYDADGAGGANAVQIGRLARNLDLTTAHIHIA